MVEVAPEQEALRALYQNVPRGELSMAAQLEYDRLRPAWERGEVTGWVPPHDVAPALAQQEPDGVWRRVDASGTTHTLRFRRCRYVPMGIIFAVFATAFLAAAAIPIVAWSQAGMWSNIWDEILFVAGGSFCVWMAICQFVGPSRSPARS